MLRPLNALGRLSLRTVAVYLLTGLARQDVQGRIPRPGHWRIAGHPRPWAFSAIRCAARVLRLRGYGRRPYRLQHCDAAFVAPSVLWQRDWSDRIGSCSGLEVQTRRHSYWNLLRH